MPIISTSNMKHVALLLLIVCIPSWAAGKNLSFYLKDKTRLEMQLGAEGVVGYLIENRNKKAVKIDKDLQHELMTADEVIAITVRAFPLERTQVVTAVARTPSIGSKPGGYCGAGHEDNLLLIEVRGIELRLLDKALLQSCLKNISFGSDKGDDPRHALMRGKYPIIATFKVISPPDYEVRNQVARVVDGKILIEQTKD